MTTIPTKDSCLSLVAVSNGLPSSTWSLESVSVLSSKPKQKVILCESPCPLCCIRFSELESRQSVQKDFTLFGIVSIQTTSYLVKNLLTIQSAAFYPLPTCTIFKPTNEKYFQKLRLWCSMDQLQTSLRPEQSDIHQLLVSCLSSVNTFCCWRISALLRIPETHKSSRIRLL